MARKWTVPVRSSGMDITFYGQTKKEAKDLVNSMWRLLLIKIHHVEYNGIFGEETHPSVAFTIGGEPYKLPNEPLYKEEVKKFLSEIPAVIYDINKVKADADELFFRHVYTVDNRKTAEQVQADKDKWKQSEDQHRAEVDTDRLEFLSEWGRDEVVDIPEGMMAVYLDITFNDSDARSDYYAPHHSIGWPLVLALVPKQNETERVARAALNRYPELSCLVYDWHTEKYSMGHGNYLQSEYTGVMHKQRAYDGRQEVNTQYEIRFMAGKGWKKLYPYRNYGTDNLNGDIPEPSQMTISMNLNKAKNGVELRLSTPPTGQLYHDLSANGFRRARWQKDLWYAKQNEKTIAFAKMLTSKPLDTTPEPIGRDMPEMPETHVQDSTEPIGASFVNAFDTVVDTKPERPLGLGIIAERFAVRVAGEGMNPEAFVSGPFDDASAVNSVSDAVAEGVSITASGRKLIPQGDDEFEDVDSCMVVNAVQSSLF